MTSRERGSATVEMAAGLPVLMVLLLVSLSGIGALVNQVRCVDAAREGALAAARGSDGRAAASRAAPAGATVSLDADRDLVAAEVSVTVRPLGPHLPGFDVRGAAVAAREPGTHP